MTWFGRDSLSLSLLFLTYQQRSIYVSSFVLPATPLAHRNQAFLPSTRIYSSSEAPGSYDEECEVLVIGSGPAARGIASLLSASSVDTILSDANYDREWAPNYGVWEDEWDSICAKFTTYGVDISKECVDTRWEVTDTYFGGSFDIPITERLRLDRPYFRIEKDKLQETFSPSSDSDGGPSYKVLKANHKSAAVGVNMYSPFDSIIHDESGSTIKLFKKDGECVSVRTKLIVDATGHETSLILRDERSKIGEAGFQIAYGALLTLDETDVKDLTHVGPYDKSAMTLFDYRTDHIPEAEVEGAESAPTFMYAMPLGGNKIFFEETSLVARPAVSFQTCKDRCFQRLDHLGIKVSSIEEEEFCYIPMGGALPAYDQRIIAFGGASAMVHPSTGYNLCRNLMGATFITDAIKKELKSSNFDPNRAAAEAYHSIWSPSNIRQRNFAVFGGEFLMKQNVKGLRGFFDGFFRLSQESWGGFLAGWPGLPNNEKHETWVARIIFGLSFIVKLPPPVAFDMLFSIITTSLEDGGALIQSVTPFLGDPPSYEYDSRPKTKTVGDIAAKREAKEMIAMSKVTEETPVAFESE